MKLTPHDYIQQYRGASVDSNGEAPETIDAIEALEPYLDQESVLAFFLGLIGDPTEYDLARIEALKILELNSLPEPALHQRIGESIALTLKSETDDLVRNWLARVLRPYRDVPSVFQLATQLLLDPSEDDDVRASCFCLLEAVGPTAPTLSALRQVSSEDDDIGSWSRKLLHDWHAA